MVNKLKKATSGKVIQDKINEIIDAQMQGGVTVDGALSTTSENPVQNKVITGALNSKIEGVQINGTNLTISSNKKVDIPVAGANTLGVGMANTAYGIYNYNNYLAISKATDALVTAKTNNFRPLVPSNIDLAVKTGITTNSLTLTDTEKNTACAWIGALPDTTPIPSAVTESTVSGWGFTKNAGTVTSVNNVSPDDNGNVSLSIPQEVFLATYGTTTYQEVLDAYNEGKIIKCLHVYSATLTFELSLVYNNTQTSSFFFAGTPDGSGIYRIANLSSTAGWNSYASIELEKASRKVTSISSSSTNTQYPSAKCVYDNLSTKVDTSSLTQVDAVTYTYNGSDSGIIIFSNKYCIQYGKVTRTAASQTVTLSRAYQNVNYAKFIQAYHTTASSDGRPPLIHEPTASGTTTSSFIANLYTGYAGFYWRTEGFLA